MKTCVLLCGILLTSVLPAEEKELHSAIKPAPRQGDWWKKRHESFNTRIAKGKVNLVFIGDSITQAWENAGKKAWEKHFAKLGAVNLGISGDRTQHVIWRLQNGNLKNITPKAAVIMIGTNNSGSNTSEEIAEGVAHIAKVLRTKSPKTKVLLLAIFPRGPNRSDTRRLVNEKANVIFSKLADGKNVYYLDIGNHFLEANGTLSKKIMPDLLHLSEQGYAIWAEAIEAKVGQLMTN